jgi:hypothetical protein
MRHNQGENGQQASVQGEGAQAATIGVTTRSPAFHASVARENSPAATERADFRARSSALSMTPTLEAEDNDEIDKYKEYWYFEENGETGDVESGRHALADTEHIRGGSLGLPGGCPTMSNGTMRVLCFGDSLTAGYWENGRRFHPYAHEATNLLGGVKIDHVGLCGYAPCPPLRSGAVARDAAETATGATEAAAARREAAGVCCHQLPLCAPPLPCVGH